MTRCTLGVVITAALLLMPGLGQRAYAKGDPVAERHLRAVEVLQDEVEGLGGDLSHERERIDLVVSVLAKDEADFKELMRIVKPVAEFVSATERGNQKKAFFEELARWACKSRQNDCELQRKYAELEERIQRLENYNLEPIPTPVEPAPAPLPAAPFEYSPRTPAPQVYGPIAPRIWKGPIDLIFDQPVDTRYAQLVAQCVNLDSADGVPCHGDMYRAWDGRYILVKHAQRIWYRSTLAAR